MDISQQPRQLGGDTGIEKKLYYPHNTHTGSEFQLCHCLSCGCQSDVPLCEQCNAWIAVYNHLQNIRATLEAWL